jgi:hypothetical protein
MGAYVYSTLTADQQYTVWRKGGGDLPTAETVVVIKGGHGLASKHFITAKGVATRVTDEQLEALNRCPSFLRHQERGFIVVSKDEVAPEKVASNMEGRDGSAPLTPQDFELKGKKAPKSGKKKTTEED